MGVFIVSRARTTPEVRRHLADERGTADWAIGQRVRLFFGTEGAVRFCHL